MYLRLGALAVAHIGQAFVDPTNDGGYELLAVTSFAALAYVGTPWLSSASVPVSQIPRSEPKHGGSLVWVIGNQPLLMLLALGFAQALTSPFFARSFAYIGKGVIHDAAWTGRALATLAVSQLVALPAWMAIARHVRQREVLAAALTIITIRRLVFATGKFVTIAGIALFEIGNAGLQMMIWAMLASSIDHSEHRTGIRLKGLPVALLLLTLKLGGGFSEALLRRDLSIIGWDAPASFGPVEEWNLLTMA